MPDEKLMNAYPAVSYLAARARRRIPHFAWEYLASGTGDDGAMRRNTDGLARITFTPRFMRGDAVAHYATDLFGTTYGAPFGIAPVGLTGLMWPRAERILARTAARYRIPYGLSTVATETPETIGALADGMGWFQLYPPRDTGVRDDLLARAREAGFKVLVVTVDVPTGSRRERQRRAGVSVPPRFALRTFYHAALRPAWSMATLRAGIPRFRMLERYVGASLSDASAFIGTQLGAVDWDYVRAVRDTWSGPMLLKGVLHPGDAARAVHDHGVDGVVVSNHGGRQFDAAPAAVDVLPGVVAALGGRGRVVFDSGVRSGLDVMRALALGADFVLLGRAFMYGVAALGARGGDHVADLLLEDLRANMGNLGCTDLHELGGFLRCE